MTLATRLRLDNYLEAGAERRALEHDVRLGLSAQEKWLPSRWFYDARGSALFNQITELAEYYPCRRETAILSARAGEIAWATQAATIIELGSGSSDKTRLLLDAFKELPVPSLSTMVPFDIDVSVLVQSAENLSMSYPDLLIHAVVGDFERHLDRLPVGGPRMFVFLGSTIGNLLPADRATFLKNLAATMQPEDTLLLGTDLAKLPSRMIAAYADPGGVTAAFNLNVLQVLRRELGADIDPDGFEHVALWNAERGWIEMRLRSRVRQQVHVLGMSVCFEEGEELRTEISAKFTRRQLAHELGEAGLEVRRYWTDPFGDYGVTLSGPTPS